MKLSNLRPRSLKAQFNLAIFIFLFLIFTSGFFGIQTLQETVVSSNQLGEEHLNRMEQAQLLVNTALLIEHESQVMLLAENVVSMHDSYTRIRLYLEKLDSLVAKLGQAGNDEAILSFQHAAQLFRGTVHVLAKLHDDAIALDEKWNENNTLVKNLTLFNRNLVQQGADILSASQKLSDAFSIAYKKAVHELTRQSERNQLQVLALLGGSLLLAWIVSNGFLGRYVIARLQKVSHYLRDVHGDGGDVELKVPVEGDDEIGEMARAVEQHMRGRQLLAQAQRDAMQTARFVAVGQLAAGIAHEINTPIQYIGDNLRFLQEVFEDITKDKNTTQWEEDLEEVSTALKDSLDGVQRISDIVLSMKEFSHPGETNVADANINRALENTLTVTQSQWKNITNVELKLSPDLPMIPCEIGKINQVFLNLIINSIQAIDESGKPLPGTISITTTFDSDWVEIRIADTGNGIPQDIRERIFDPFFTTKPIGVGTGQGLTICHDVVVIKHHGTIEVAGGEGEGVEFIIRLPRT